MREHTHQIFGKGRTGVLVKGKLSKEKLLNALQLGRSIITEGPFAIMQAYADEGTREIGDTVTTEQLRLRLYAHTTDEFGDFDTIELFCGDIKQKRETVVKKITLPIGRKTVDEMLSLQNLPERGYLRLVCRTRRQGKEYWCLTNPIWIDRFDSQVDST